MIAATLNHGTAITDAGKRYSVKSGIIKFEYAGARTGTEIMYFDKYGLREAKYTDVEINNKGEKQEDHKLELIKDNFTYKIDLAANTGIKIKTPFTKDMIGQDMTKEHGESMMEEMGGKKVGTGEILGKECEIWEMKSFGTKTWVHKGIILKTESDFMGMKYSVVATDIQFDVDVPEEKFELPKGVKLSKGQDLEDLMKNPKGGK